jgi:hypothetical protein
MVLTRQRFAYSVSVVLVGADHSKDVLIGVPVTVYAAFCLCLFK